MFKNVSKEPFFWKTSFKDGESEEEEKCLEYKKNFRHLLADIFHNALKTTDIESKPDDLWFCCSNTNRSSQGFFTPTKKSQTNWDHKSYIFKCRKSCDTLMESEFRSSFTRLDYSTSELNYCKTDLL